MLRNSSRKVSILYFLLLLWSQYIFTFACVKSRIRASSFRYFKKIHLLRYKMYVLSLSLTVLNEAGVNTALKTDPRKTETRQHVGV